MPKAHHLLEEAGVVLLYPAALRIGKHIFYLAVKLPFSQADGIAPERAPHPAANPPLNFAGEECDDSFKSDSPFLHYVDDAMEMIGHDRIVGRPHARKLRLD